MNALENEYFEEYKAVEQICNDMYENGVSGYIDEMYENMDVGKRLVPNWYKKVKVLKRLRWLRNRIAHGGEDYEVTAQDFQSLKMFHNELLSGTDPLSQINAGGHTSQNQSHDYEEHGWNGWVILLVLVLIIMLVFFTSRMR